MCDCINRVPSDVLKKLNEKADGKYEEARMLNVGFSFSEEMVTRLYNEVEYQFTPYKKGGIHGKRCTKKITILHTFCPFCGEKLIIEKPV